MLKMGNQQPVNKRRKIMPNRMTKEGFEQKIKENFPNEDIQIIEYTKASSEGKYKCLKCGNTTSIYKMGDLLRKKHICNICFYSKGVGDRVETSKKQIEKLFRQNADLQFIGYGYNQKIEKNTVIYKCKKCGSINEKVFSQFKKVPKCSYCSSNAQKINTQGFISRLPEGYTILEDYKTTDSKILFRHSCGFIWKTTPHNIISGNGCPKCAKGKSKGEKKIIDFLEKNKIIYESEKSFDWSDKKRYDFYLPNYDLLIEYNGVQHYKDIKFYGKYQLEEIQKIDKWKKEQALLHDFNFYEISYEDFEKIEDLLAQRLNIEYPTGIKI